MTRRWPVIFMPFWRQSFSSADITSPDLLVLTMLTKTGYRETV